MMTTRERMPVKHLLLLAILLICSFELFAQKKRIEKLHNLYDCLKDYHIRKPKTVLAIAIFETGWLECKHCTLQYNNLFGFRANRDYIRFESVYDCLEYLKKWQVKYYHPWKLRHPRGTYYEFLIHIKYAQNMESYLKTIKPLEEWISRNIVEED